MVKEAIMIKKYPSSILRKKAKPIKNVTDNILDILDKMVSIMHDNHGIGLAATQIGIDLSLAVVDAGDGLKKMINPEILKKDGCDIMEEGCLSIPRTIVKVRRAKSVTVQYLDEKGKIVKIKSDGLTAKAVQHEIDHLCGRLIIDYMPWYKRVVFAAVNRNLE